MKNNHQSLSKSFINAFNGIANFFAKERNAKIQLSIAIVAVISGFIFHISNAEWLLILVCIALVLGLEMVNSTIEKICDMIEPNYNLKIKIIKDVAAGAVLWCAIFSAIIGCMIFLPKILLLL